MPSKGPSGSTTVTQRNPTGEAQLPFLTQGWNQAKNLYEQIGGPRYYPGETLAGYTPPNPYQAQGYQNLVGTAQSIDQTLRPTGNAAWGTLATGTGTPAANQMNQYALGQDPNQQALRQQAGQAIASGNQYAQALGGGNLGLSTLGTIAGGGGAGMEQLAKTLGGAYLSPDSNPYIRGVVDAAQRPVTDAYQRSTAPQTDYNFATSGRYGSGALLGARSQNEQNLGRSLGDISTNIYGQNYANERARQDAAANQYAGLQQTAGSNYGQLYNQGQTAAATAALAGLGMSGQNLTRDIASQQDAQGRIQSGQISAIQNYGNLLNSQYSGAKALTEAGQGLSGIDDTVRQQQQAVINDQMNRYNAQQMEPFKDLSMYLQNIGQPMSAGSSTSTPYFQNQVASTLSGLAGVKSLLGGLGGLGGAGTGLSSALAGDAAMTAAGIPTLTAGLAGPVTAAAGAEGLAAAAPLAAAWIICTELMRQGRMPKRWYLAGYPVFGAYPEIGRRGYYVWAIPSVRHLRRHPNSLYSRVLCTAFNWRAEDIAARQGVKGARRLWRGRAVTAALVLPCLALGALSRHPDWRSVYREA
jgi:hypothetical protein